MSPDVQRIDRKPAISPAIPCKRVRRDGSISGCRDRQQVRGDQEVSMRRWLVIATAILISCGAAQAQTTMSTPGLRATSPLGMPGSMGSSGTGIPLGATEINPGGLSPVQGSTCNPNVSPLGMSGGMSSLTNGTTGTTGATTTFDGGGVAAAGSATSACVLSPAPAMSGTASSLSTLGSNASARLNGGAIPLDSTELDSGGVSPMITVPPPGMTSPSPCGGLTTTGSVGLSPGSTSGGVSALGLPGC
jgi:hypothetical protein